MLICRIIFVAMFLVHLSTVFGFQRPSKVPSYGQLAMSPFGFLNTLMPTKKLSNDEDIRETKLRLEALAQKVQPNGVYASKEQRARIEEAIRDMEALNPTKDPALSPKMAGFWRLLYSDFDPPQPSSGKLGPFVGEVYQNLEPEVNRITNILRVPFPDIKGGLVAQQSIRDKQTWQINFQRVSNKLFGFKIQSKVFAATEKPRFWKITYLDDDFRIVRAGLPETPPDKLITFVLQRAEHSRFSVDL